MNSHNNKKLLIIAYSLFVAVSACDASSDASYPQRLRHGSIRSGLDVFNHGFIVDQGAHVTLNLVLPVNGCINLGNNSILTLDGDLTFRSGASLVIGSDQGDCATLYGGAGSVRHTLGLHGNVDLPAQRALMIDGVSDITIDGHGNTVLFNDASSIRVASGRVLTLRNMTINGLRGISNFQGEGTLALDNVVINIHPDEAWMCDVKLHISGLVVVRGGGAFVQSDNKQLIVNQFGLLHIDHDTVIANNFLSRCHFYDSTSCVRTGLVPMPQPLQGPILKTIASNIDVRSISAGTFPQYPSAYSAGTGANQFSNDTVANLAADVATWATSVEKFIITNSNSMLARTRHNSNTLLFLNRNNSNTLLFLERADSNAKLFLTKNNSNTLLNVNSVLTQAVAGLQRELNTIDHGPNDLHLNGMNVTYTLSLDLFLSPSHVLEFNETNNLNGGGHAINLASGANGIIKVAANKKVVLSNIVIKNFNESAFQFGANAQLILGNGTCVELARMQTLAQTWTNAGKVVWSGFDNSLMLVGGGKLMARDQGVLTLQNIRLDGVANNNVRCFDPASTIVFKNAALILSQDYSFTSGKMTFSQDVLVAGPHTFTYRPSNAASGIDANSTLFFDIGSTFKFNPQSGGLGTLGMIDQTSRLFLNGSTLYAAGSFNMILTKGVLAIDHTTTFSFDFGRSITFGDGTTPNNLAVHILPSAKIRVLGGGSLIYNNTD